MASPYWRVQKISETIGEDQEAKMGKWMLYYRKEDVEQAWDRAQRRIEDLKDAGVLAMKASTVEIDNPSAKESKFIKEILFYCAPHTDIQLMRTIGFKIVEIMDYKAVADKLIYFKTDAQTAVGTGASGVQAGRNHKAEIAVRETIWSELRSPETQARVANRERVPMEVQNEKQMWVTDFKNPNKLPSIRLYYEPQYLDEAWLRAKDLFQKGELPQCKQVVVETANDFISMGRRDRDHWIKAMR